MSYSYTFEIGEAEQVRASRIVMNRRGSTRAVYAFFILGVLLVVATCARDVWSGRSGRNVGMGVVIAGLVGGLAGVYIAPRSAVRSLRKRNRACTGPQTQMINATGLQASGPGATASYEWENIVEVLETREFLLFYVSVAWAALLPQRVVPAAELASLRRSLAEWAIGGKVNLFRTEG